MLIICSHFFLCISYLGPFGAQRLSIYTNEGRSPEFNIKIKVILSKIEALVCHWNYIIIVHQSNKTKSEITSTSCLCDGHPLLVGTPDNSSRVFNRFAPDKFLPFLRQCSQALPVSRQFFNDFSGASRLTTFYDFSGASHLKIPCTFSGASRLRILLSRA